jgi:hypothetical protein
VGRRGMAGDERAALDLGARLCWEDECGQNLRPPRATTWAPRGRTPIVRVMGKGYGRVAPAGPVCARPGERTRPMYRVLVRRGRPGEVKGFGPARFAALTDAVPSRAARRLHRPDRSAPQTTVTSAFKLRINTRQELRRHEFSLSNCTALDSDIHGYRKLLL